MIPTPDQMSQVDKEAEQKKAIVVQSKVLSERLNIVSIDDEESSSYSSMSLYSIKSNGKGSEVSSRRTPTLVENQVLEQLAEVHSYPTMDKNQLERHSQIQQQEEDLSSYNIDEIFEAFTFNLYKMEISRKRIRNEKQSDGNLKEVQKDEVLFERTDEDPIIVATASATLSEATIHNVTMLSQKLSQAKSDNYKLKEEFISLREEIHKRRKVDDETTPL
jgi:hypothetical protein